MVKYVLKTIKKMIKKKNLVNLVSNYFMIHNEWLFIEIKLEMLIKTYIILMGPRRMDIFYWIDFVHIIPISYTNNLQYSLRGIGVIPHYIEKTARTYI